MSNKMFWATGLTGGNDALDGIDGNLLSVGDGAIVLYNDGINDRSYEYRVQTSSATESSPGIISPDANAGTKRWHLVSITSGVDVRGFASINAAVTTIGSTVTTLIVSNAQTQTASLTIPSTLSLKILNGGSIVKLAGCTVTINGPFEVGLYQVFSGFSAGDVTFGSGAVKEVYPEWWVTNTTPGTTDMITGLTSAYSSITKGIVFLQPQTYKTTLKWTISKSNITVDGPGSVISFVPTADHATNNAVILINNNDVSATRDTTGAIAVGDTSFVSTTAVADLVANDWIYVWETEATAGDEIILFDYMQVASVVGTTVNVLHAFRTAFPATHSTVHFNRINTLVDSVTVRNIKVLSTDTTNQKLGIYTGIAQNVLIENVVADVYGNAFNTYRTKGYTLRNCRQLKTYNAVSEIAATVDFNLEGNTFTNENNATMAVNALAIDFGSAFFSCIGNHISAGKNRGIVLLGGVHDGVVTGNVINAMDSSSVSYLSILLIGCYQNIVANNILVGLPSITTSYGVGVYDSYGVALHGNIIGPNIIKGFTGEYICPNLDEEFITNTPQVVSIIAAGATLTPSPGAKLISMTSSVPTAIIMDDAPTKQGRVIQIVNISTNACNFADTSGVSELAGAFAMGQWDTLTLIYLTDRWVELGRSDN